MSQNKENLVEALKVLKQRILDVEQKSTKLSEQDTRQGLINALFRALGWDLSDFDSVKSELRHKSYNEPVDYAFFHRADKNRPVLLVEAKSLGKNLNDGKIVKQLCTYLGEMGVQWGVLTDGNKYVMYNSKSGSSFEEQKFLTLQIKTADTEDGISLDDLAEKFLALLSRKCLENDQIQCAYENLAIDRNIKEALDSLLTAPFETLASAIRREFKEERVKIDSNIRITQKQIVSYLEKIQDEDGRIFMEGVAESSISESNVLHDIAQSQEQEGNSEFAEKSSYERRTKRITISDLLKGKMIDAGDSWRFENKGEFTWGRVTSNGEIEVNGKTYTTPSRAGKAITKKSSCDGWTQWFFKDSSNKWCPVNDLREQYRKRHGFSENTRIRKAS